MTGLVNGTPQVVCPGKVFERQYNAWSVQNLKAGLMLAPENFTPTGLRDAVSRLASDPRYSQNAFTAGSELLALGGVASIYTELELRYHK
jgi:UDP:flavonoid glycosyltransferase YjiC (YdhE family)